MPATIDLNLKQNQINFLNVLEVRDYAGPETQPVYFYSISPLEFTVNCPPNHSYYPIKPCPRDEQWLLVGSITHPFPQMHEDPNTGRKITEYVNGFREATKMLSPHNPGLDQNFVDVATINVNRNLNDFGVFWSINYPPTEQELRAAKTRMEATYRKELDELQRLEFDDPLNAKDRSNKLSHAAAEYFGVTTSWHRSLVKKDETLGKMLCPAGCDTYVSKEAAVCTGCKAILNEEKARKYFPHLFAFEKNNAEVETESSTTINDKMAKMREAKRLKQLT